jgi:hypothetical protein
MAGSDEKDAYVVAVPPAKQGARGTCEAPINPRAPQGARGGAADIGTFAVRDICVIDNCARLGTRSSGIHQREVFPYHGRGRERGNFGHVIGRGNLDDVHSAEVQPSQRT